MKAPLLRSLIALPFVFASPLSAFAGSAKIAVAANFTDAAKEIAAAFKAKTGHDAVLSFGASGPLAAQIRQHAPFDAFLSADEDRPKALADDGLAAAQTRFTYAIGKLVLWSRDPNFVKGPETLKANAFAKLAIANPAAAPYGAAALETVKALEVEQAVSSKIVQGNSIAQALQFVQTGNAELGFVALAQLRGADGSRWLVPQQLYTPIRQDAVLLKSGESNEAARAFIAFLRGPEALAIIEAYGYEAPSKGGS